MFLYLALRNLYVYMCVYVYVHSYLVISMQVPDNLTLLFILGSHIIIDPRNHCLFCFRLIWVLPIETSSNFME